MRVLIVPASRFGATAEIGRAMARTLRAEGLDVDVSQPDQMFNLAPYAAHIIGSSVYFGEWLDSAVTFVEEHAAEIRSKPTWLFSSGPFGPGTPDQPLRPEVIAELLRLTAAVDHNLFGGRLELDRLPTRERFMAGWVGAEDTDLRDWDEIERWTKGIAASLTNADRPPGSPAG